MQAIGKNIVVTKNKPEAKTNSGIIYTDNNLVTTGCVVTVGTEVSQVQAGQNLVLNWNAAMPVKLSDAETVYIVNIDNVFAVM